MPSDRKKGITVQIDAELHAEVRQYVESHGMTMAEFVILSLQDELHPKFNMNEDKGMEKMRTLAFQVPDSLFQKIKDYLSRNNMTQKELVIGLIENELQRELNARNAVNETEENLIEEHDDDDYTDVSDDEVDRYREDVEEYSESDETTAVSDSETVSEEAENYAEEQNKSGLSDDFEDKDTEYSEDVNESEEDEEDIGFSMEM